MRKVEETEFSLVPKKLKVNPLVMAVFFGGLFLLAVGLGLVFFKGQKDDDVQIISTGAQVAGEKTTPLAGGEIMVHVDGAVLRPGVYKLSGEARVDDAIKAAGGTVSDADGTKVNLAAKLIDGQKVYVPTTSEQVVSGQGLVVGQSQNGLISINSGTQAELESLPGVGPVTAQKIISLRPYGSVEELLSKKVVGASTFEKIKDKVTIY